MTDNVQKIVRGTASSGKVDYAPPVVLNETSKSKLHAMAWFIRRSDGRTEFSLKLEGFLKAKNDPWTEDKAKTLTLSQAASLQLLKYLQTHIPAAAQTEAGDFILIRVSDGEASLAGHDPQVLIGALTKVLSQAELVQHLSSTELTHELSTALRGALRLSEMRSAVADLRASLSRGVSSERVYQMWCEKHCWAFGNAYVVRDEVRAISTGDNLDLMLPNVIAGYRDVVELKRPDDTVLLYDSAHRNY